MNNSVNISKEGYLHESYHYFHLRDTAGQERSFHFHDFDKIVLLLSGNVDYTVENTVYPLQPWSVLLVRHHAIHRALIDVSAPYERIILYLDPGFFERIFPSAGLMDCFRTADRTGRCLLLPDDEQREELSALLASFEKALSDERPGSDTMRDTLIAQLLITINRISAAECPAPDRAADEKIRQTLSYINENLSSDLSIDTLADRVFLSRYHFMRLFKEQTGSTVHQYVRQKRLLYAARLIREGVPAVRAASDAGFNDYSVFHRAFRSSFSISPTDLK
ncbi:MAG: helix-turn-helix domain-containing protein [Oscillospiraceae bacterium]|nr:helix-turn-helix domain-containing protein [Oscillospiraceae bacterium]